LDQENPLRVSRGEEGKSVRKATRKCEKSAALVHSWGKKIRKRPLDDVEKH